MAEAGTDIWGTGFGRLPLAARIDRHLATGRTLYHAPVTAERLPVLRQFVAQSQALLAEAAVAGLGGDRDARLRMAIRALSQRAQRPAS